MVMEELQGTGTLYMYMNECDVDFYSDDYYYNNRQLTTLH
jgi:hypothetical protein